MPNTPTKAKIFITGLRVTADVPEYFCNLYGTAEQIETKILADQDRIVADGYDVTLFYVDERDVEGSLAHIDRTLRAGKFDGVMVGTGLRLIPSQTPLYEKVMNTVIQASPKSLFMFNDGPGGNFAAIKRNHRVA